MSVFLEGERYYSVKTLIVSALRFVFHHLKREGETAFENYWSVVFAKEAPFFTSFDEMIRLPLEEAIKYRLQSKTG